MNLPHCRPSLLPAWAIVLSLGIALFATPSFAAAPKKLTAKSIAFHEDMRSLWQEHVAWTRLFLVEAAAGAPGKGATTDRLLKNQDDIGDAVKPYYGETIGQKLELLLTEHIKIAAEIVEETKEGDHIKAGDAEKRWLANADEIATFLSSANPKSWPEADMKKMMREHLTLTRDEATAQLQGDFQTSILNYDKAYKQILHMADMLSAGIVAQFPEKF